MEGLDRYRDKIGKSLNKNPGYFKKLFEHFKIQILRIKN